jgi:hypothetical protein
MVKIAPEFDASAGKLFHPGTRQKRWRMWTLVVLMISMVASLPALTGL